MGKVISNCWGFPLLILVLLVNTQQAAAADKSKCGVKRLPPMSLITNGEKVIPGEWPWHVALFHREKEPEKQYICGGTIISKHFVLTAAHCFQHQTPDRYFFKAGVHWLHNDTDPNLVTYNLSEIVIHPKYKPQNVTYLYDMALARPDEVISFQKFNIFPICLWPEHDPSFIDIFKQIGLVAGFGLTENQTISDVLFKASVGMLDKQQCLRNFKDYFIALHENDGTICSDTRNNKNVIACRGDSGGGLYYGKNQVWYLRGIVSAAHPLSLDNGDITCDPNVTTIYTDVAEYRSWINVHQQIVDQRNLLNLKGCGVASNAEVQDEIQKPMFNQYPWNVLVEIRQVETKQIFLVCNGVLVHPRYVLTVGHCVDGSFANYKLHSVRLGEYDIRSKEDSDPNAPSTPITYQSIDIERVFFKYHRNKPRYANNLALLKLKYDADTRKPNIQPICLPALDEYKDSSLTLVGWKRNKVKFPMLERDAMNVSSTTTCNREYEKFRMRLPATDNVMCAEYRVRPKGQCHSYASGSALQYIKRVDRVSRYFLAGLLVFNLPRCYTQGSETFLNVASAAQWIKDTVN